MEREADRRAQVQALGEPADGAQGRAHRLRSLQRRNPRIHVRPRSAASPRIDRRAAGHQRPAAPQPAAVFRVLPALGLQVQAAHRLGRSIHVPDGIQLRRLVQAGAREVEHPEGELERRRGQRLSAAVRVRTAHRRQHQTEIRRRHRQPDGVLQRGLAAHADVDQRPGARRAAGLADALSARSAGKQPAKRQRCLSHRGRDASAGPVQEGGAEAGRGRAAQGEWAGRRARVRTRRNACCRSRTWFRNARGAASFHAGVHGGTVRQRLLRRAHPQERPRR